MSTEGKELNRPSLATIKRFLSHVEVMSFGRDKGCWLWTGYLRQDDEHRNSRYGVFRIWLDGKWTKRHAHRVSFAIFHGSVPKGFDVNHECGRHNCVNPDHLSLMSRGANVADGNRNRNGGGNADVPF